MVFSVLFHFSILLWNGFPLKIFYMNISKSLFAYVDFLYCLGILCISMFNELYYYLG